MPAVREWINYTPQFVAKRYNRIAKIYPVFERIFFLPGAIRRKAVEALMLNKGDKVLEIGCGTGRNLALLSEAVGNVGAVFGIDVSEEMLRRAEILKKEQNLTNLNLTLTDASTHSIPGKLNGALFSLSYATMINRKEVLFKVWNSLQSGGRIVIMDAQIPTGFAGKIMTPLKPFITLFLKASVLGNPGIRPIEELKEITCAEVHQQEFSMKSYFFASAQKI